MGDAYNETREWIKAQGGDKSRLGILAVMLVGHAERLPKADELCYTPGAELHSPDFNARNVSSMLNRWNFSKSSLLRVGRHQLCD